MKKLFKRNKTVYKGTLLSDELGHFAVRTCGLRLNFSPEIGSGFKKGDKVKIIIKTF